MHRTHYLIWRRGVAPILFILAIALIIIAVGIGIYFTIYKSDSPVIENQSAAIQSVEPVATTTATTTVVNALIVQARPVPQIGVKYYDCGSSEKSTECIKNRSRTCAPTKAIAADTESGVRGELVIDGYQGNSCSYQIRMLSGGATPMLAGLNMHCMIPKDMFDGTMTIMDDAIFAFCTGTLIDFMREQENPS